MSFTPKTTAAPLVLDRIEPQEVSVDVLIEKYAKFEEKNAGDHVIGLIRRRVAQSLSMNEKEQDRAKWEGEFIWAMENGFIPAGRINSAGGTDIQATLINCFVQPVGDSVSEDKDGKPSIYKALAQAAETMRRGGGVGYNFSAIRPKGAKVKGTHSQASGPISYMHVFDQSCATVESAGARRGAQMGMMNCDHPDVLDFIKEKSKKGSLNNFNVSVAVSDPFMEAVVAGADWELFHKAEPSEDLLKLGAYQRDDGMWVYSKISAAAMWEEIMRNTYDQAEPGIIFLDRVNQENNLAYCEYIEATNPCVTGDTRLHTSRGMVRIDELFKTQEANYVTVDRRALTQGAETGTTQRLATPAFITSHDAPIFEVKTDAGYSVKATDWHNFHVGESGSFVRLKDLKVGDEIWIQSGKGQFGSEGSRELGEVMGLIAGDGHFTNRGLGQVAARLDFWNDTEGVAERMLDNTRTLLSTMPPASNKRVYDVGLMKVTERDLKSIRSVTLARFFERYEFNAVTKLKVPDVVWKGTEECVKGYLRALFNADGTVQYAESNRSCSVRLSSSTPSLLTEVQQLLSNFGIMSSVLFRRRAQERAMPNGKGGQSLYKCQANYELLIGGAHRNLFMSEIGFLGTSKNKKANNFISAMPKGANAATFRTRVKEIISAGTSVVYDVTQPDKHSIIFCGIVTGNCAEQPLPNYGCCCLGSVNLTVFVRDAFGPNPTFDFELMKQVFRVATRMLDNVLDRTHWPLPEQFTESRNKRRVGLGFTGLGNALAMLKVKYNSPEGLQMAAMISEAMRDAAYESSSATAAEKGSFLLFDAEKYLASGFASRLPEHIKALIRKQGLRNSHLLSIAPTGTISLAFADNASNGIEPPFSYFYDRKKREQDGTLRTYQVEDYGWRLFKAKGGDVANLPSYFVTALEMSAIDHMNMVAAVAPYIDSAISKTVNVPEDYPYEDFKGLYLQAWRSGLKGIATYRPNATLGSVLSVTPVSVPAPNPESARTVEDFNDDANRRLTIKTIPEPVLGSLLWPDRPKFAAGNSAWTYMVDHPEGDFTLFVGEAEESELHENGRKNVKAPFEVWIQGRKAPRGLGAIAKTLSLDLRAADKAWISKKLEALSKTRGETPFQMAMPPTGEPEWMSSACQAVAKLIMWRADQMGSLDDEDSTPMVEREWIKRQPLVDSLFSEKEPKTGTGGTMGWMADVFNPATGDDFLIGLKEITLPDGTHRPYSVWMSGVYPKAFDGLCKLLSLDMRVIDPAWVGMKLRKLSTYSEPLGEFMAKIPGNPDGKSATWPSTVAYVAALITHRFVQLGILDHEGHPVSDMGLMAPRNRPQHPHLFEGGDAPAADVVGGVKRTAGKICPECHAPAMIKKDGCEFCTACGHVGSCG